MAKISDLLASGRTLSFEFFPPKTDEMERQLEKAVFELQALAPAFVSVTEGAGGSTKERTRDIVVRLQRDRGLPAMAHLTCMGPTRHRIVELLDQYADAGVRNVLALLGDPPADGSPVTGDFRYALELCELVKGCGDFAIGVAAHPEGHPRSPDLESDRRHLAEKLECADFAVTQFFFRAEDYVGLVEQLRALGCDKPVIPGIMPIQNVAGLRRMAGMNNTTVPPQLLDRLDAVADDAESVRRIGVEVATELSQRLLDEGAPALHLYALNRSESCLEICANLEISGTTAF